jgi:succinoglycan biosynthesis protein ExoM
MELEHISVCICTYKRPVMLAKAIQGVLEQVTEGKFSYEIVVVDNDTMRSAENTVGCFQNKAAVIVRYDCEPVQNISLARNRAVANARGNLIAFLDDDEVPEKYWLLNLYNTMKELAVDGVLGPYPPFYPQGAPEWLKKSNLLGQRRLPTGTRLTSRDTRTGNVLLSREVFEEGSMWFDAAFGRTGGEDVDFFKRRIEEGRVFVWCDEAVAYETIPPERWQTSFYLKKYLRIGTMNGERLRRGGMGGMVGIVKTIASMPVRIVLFLMYLPFGKHLWIEPALKLVYAGTCLLGYCGVSVSRYRDESRS